MKLAPLLTQYLYANKRLTLQGIGTFQLDPSVYIETSNSKNPNTVTTNGISFQSDASAKQDEEFIKYISAETGKMKALAVSDLESYLELMQQFLNIGKPFQIDGIGTIVKNRNRDYEFTSGQLMNERISEDVSSESVGMYPVEDPATSFRDMYKKQAAPGFTLTKAFIALLLLGGVGFAVWGGYALYDKNRNTASASVETNATQILPVEDTLKYTAQIKPDSTPKVIPAATPGYKFVFEATPNKNRAIKRFNFIKNINPDIHLETTDSSLFKITVNMVIPPSDTLRIKDSLNAWYYGTKDILVKIESSNNQTQNVP